MRVQAAGVAMANQSNLSWTNSDCFTLCSYVCSPRVHGLFHQHSDVTATVCRTVTIRFRCLCATAIKIKIKNTQRQQPSYLHINLKRLTKNNSPFEDDKAITGGNYRLNAECVFPVMTERDILFSASDAMLPSWTFSPFLSVRSQPALTETPPPTKIELNTLTLPQLVGSRSVSDTEHM